MRTEISRLRRYALVSRSIALAAVSLLACAAARAETRYTVLMMGKPAGAQTANVKSSGEREYTFEYNDRGRGPKLTSLVIKDGRVFESSALYKSVGVSPARR